MAANARAKSSADTAVAKAKIDNAKAKARREKVFKQARRSGRRREGERYAEEEAPTANIGKTLEYDHDVRAESERSGTVGKTDCRTQ